MDASPGNNDVAGMVVRGGPFGGVLPEEACECRTETNGKIGFYGSVKIQGQWRFISTRLQST